MAYKSLIEKSLERAFKSLKDLAVDAVFTRRGEASFDFNTGQTSYEPSTSLNTKIVVTRKLRPDRESNRLRKEIIAKNHVIGDVKAFDTILFEGEHWSIGGIIHGDGYIWVLEIYKEIESG